MSLASHWRGHFLLFERRPAPVYSAAAGLRILLAVLLLEGVVGPRWHFLGWLGAAQPPAVVRVALSLALALVLVRYFARVPLRELGFLRWREWSAAEKSYFIQVLVLANVVFALLFAGRIHGSSAIGLVVAANFLWGFHQELVYRGMLQTELVRRLGPAAGILIANLLFTFGPLHFYHLSRPSPWPMMAGIFVIGLFFALLYHRSRNLWLAAIFHGIGSGWMLAAFPDAG